MTDGSAPHRSRDARVWLRRASAVLVYVVVYVVPLVALGLMVRPALSKPLWTDESATWQFSALGLADLWRATSHVDRDLLPYYFVVHVIRALGAGVMATRLVSLCCSAVAVVCTQLVAKRLWGHLGAAVGGLALALNPVFCLWSAQARPVAMGYAFVAAGTALAVRWTQASRVAYPVVVTAGALLFPPTALAIVPQVLWRWRAAGLRDALRALVFVGPGVVAVAVGEILSWGQVSEMTVASGRTPRNAAVAVGHALGAAGGLPWLHVAAVVGAVAVLLLQRGRQHAVARRGVAFAILLADGTAALAWGFTALGVPMLADNLLVAVPIGAALLLGGLIGHPWFAPVNTDADVGIAFRGGIAVALLLTSWFAGAWWMDRAGKDVTLDGATYVAQTLAGQARVGDLIMFQQPYAAGGYLSSLATAAGDQDLQDTLLRRLPSGAAHTVLRRITAVDATGSAVRTVEARPSHDAARVWVVRVLQDPLAGSLRSVLACSNPVHSHSQVVVSDVDLYTCGGGSPPQQSSLS